MVYIENNLLIVNFDEEYNLQVPHSERRLREIERIVDWEGQREVWKRSAHWDVTKVKRSQELGTCGKAESNDNR